MCVCVCSDSSVNTSDAALIKKDADVCRMWGGQSLPCYTASYNAPLSCCCVMDFWLRSITDQWEPVGTSGRSSCMAPGPVLPFLPIGAAHPLRLSCQLSGDSMDSPLEWIPKVRFVNNLRLLKPECDCLASVRTQGCRGGMQGYKPHLHRRPHTGSLKGLVELMNLPHELTPDSLSKFRQ